MDLAPAGDTEGVPVGRYTFVMTSQTQRSHSRGWLESSRGAVLLSLILAIATPATVVLGVLALMKPLLPPDMPLAGLGIALAGPAVGMTMFGFGGYFGHGRDRAEGADRPSLD